jgi:hypothetical protein
MQSHQCEQELIFVFARNVGYWTVKCVTNSINNWTDFYSVEVWGCCCCAILHVLKKVGTVLKF